VLQAVTPGYFEAMGISVLEGRPFDVSDRVDAPPVAVVSELAARRFWPDGAVGRRLRIDDPEIAYAEIVGVVADVRQDRLDREPLHGSVYFAHAQAPATYPAVGSMSLAILTEIDPTSVASSVRAAILELDAGIPVYEMRTMEQTISDDTAPQRFVLLLQLVFASVAASLAAVGLYAVLSYSVAQRTAEMGVRMALGADRGEVRRMVIRQGMGFVGAAVVIGVAGALAASRLLQALLFEVSAAEPAVYVAVVGLLTMVALVACWIPARRASGVDPVVALRSD
jgi:putative ABC transport system permease protein